MAMKNNYFSFNSWRNFSARRRIFSGYFHFDVKQSVRMFRTVPITSTEMSDKFEAVYSEVVNAIAEDESYNEVPLIRKRLENLLEYNLPNGKKTRGLQTVNATCIISPHLDEERLKLASILGWCVELLHAFYLVHDDIIDEAKIRRGRPCWYQIHNNGLNAINDGVLLENSIYSVLRKYFKNESYYTNIFEEFHNVTIKTSIGQALDSLTSKSFKLRREFDQFTSQNYASIVKYKTAMYSFLLPVSLAMYMGGINEISIREKAASLLLRIGQYYQVQDDFLDCFGDEKLVRKTGNDVAEGKCTWLIINALQRANENQKFMLQENYGQPDPSKVEEVKKVYEDIGLKNIYDEYEKCTYNNLLFEIDHLSSHIPPKIFTSSLDKIYQRKY